MNDPLFVQAKGAQAAPGDGAQIAVPSGQAVSLLEVIWNEVGPEGLTTRFRFLAPQIARIGGTISSETALADIQYLCQEFALPRIPNTGPMPQQIVISLSDRPVPFGQSAPDATQFFEAFAFQDGSCIWEMY